VKALAAQAGIGQDVLAAKGSELFPGKAPRELTAENFEALWLALDPRRPA
jgi:hypothetical protein